MRLALLTTLVLAVVVSAPPAAAAQAAADLLGGRELHDITLHINSRDWDQLRATYTENTYYPCDVEWHGIRVRNAGCRSRGLGSRNGVKPGLKIEFGHYVDGQTFLGLHSLVLDNLWQDPSMIRERLSMLLFERMGLPAPRESHARLFVGSGRQYWGVYAVVEDVDKRFIDRHYGESGHLYEYRWVDEYHFTDLGPELEPYAVRFEPRMRTRESAYSLFAPVRDMVRAVAESREGALAPAVERYLDLSDVLRYVATENFLAEQDGFLGLQGMNNFYLYLREGNNGGELIPWDKDQTMMWLEMPPWYNVERNPLMQRVWATPELRQSYLQKVLKATEWAGWLAAEVDRAYAEIREAVLADPVKPTSNAEFEAAVRHIRTFARQRAAIVRDYLSSVGVVGRSPAVQ
jgi:spore coat protein CotH